MQSKIKKFAALSIVMTTTLFLCLVFLDLHDSNASDILARNLIIAIAVGLGTPAALIFGKRSHRKTNQ
jgi:hypothetical protein